MERKIWWVTRPTRDLRDIEEALKCFAEIARNKKWKGNRELHKKFEQENPAKTPNVGQHGGEGSGGRTWAAWLRMWGLWYREDCVALTDAGELIASSTDPSQIHKQIVHMMMMFQITSAYHERLRPKQEKGFRVFPFRFMLKLLLNGQIGTLSQDEIGLFLLNVKKPDEYSSVVDKILEWRKQTKDEDQKAKIMSKMIRRHKKKYGTPRADSPEDIKEYWRSIRDISNTLMVNMGFIDEIDYDKKSGTISIQKDFMDNAKKLLKKYDHIQFSNLYNLSDNAFTRKFGIRYDRRKASKKDTAPMTPAKKQHKRIKEAVEKLQKTENIDDYSILVKRVQRVTHYPIEIVEQTISENTDLENIGKDDAEFAEYYFHCAGSGSEHAEFEDMTRKIFALMGFETKKQRIPKSGSGEREIDGLVLNKDTCMSGLLECKSGAKYTFPVGDCAKMRDPYIEHFRKKQICGKTYSLDFFVYVVGRKATGLNNFKEIADKTGMRGSVIYATDLFQLYCLSKQGKITPVSIWGLFKSNKLLTSMDVFGLVKN